MVTLADVKSMAAALGQATTHAPQPMQAAASKAVSAFSLPIRTASHRVRSREAR